MPVNQKTTRASDTRPGLQHQFEVEQELAQRLRAAPQSRRGALYPRVYDELYQRVPMHPQLARLCDQERQQRLVGRQLRLLAPMLDDDTVFLEVGAGDGRLSLAVAELARQVYAIDVSEQIAHVAAAPANFSLHLTDGTSIPVPDGSVDLAFSNQLMEHLHPDDAMCQLGNIHRALAPGGRYVCRTPNRLTGPHDISRAFGREVRGLHLKEYTSRELVGLFHQAGFERVRTFIWIRGHRVAWSLRGLRGLEWLVSVCPYSLRRPLTAGPPLRTMLGLNLIGSKR